MSNLFCEEGTKIKVKDTFRPSKYCGKEGTVTKVGRIFRKELSVDIPVYSVELKDGSYLLLYAKEFELCE